MISEQVNNVPVKTIRVGTGIFASYKTLKIMRDIIRNSSKNYYVRRWAEKIVESIPCCDYERALAIYEFIQENTQYLKDPHRFEFMKTPPVILKLIEAGELPLLDCDDATLLSLSLLSSIGIRTKIIATSYKADHVLKHVYGAFQIKGNWIYIDASNHESLLGWEHTGITKRVTLEV